MLKKYEPSCIFCGDMEGIRQVHGKNVCSKCIEELKQL
jgi:transcriptional pleiotropic regulator of transition state genes